VARGDFFRVMVGAILTRTPLEKCREGDSEVEREEGIKSGRDLSLKKSQLASLIKSSGYYRIKADRLQAFINFLFEEFDGDLKKMGREKLGGLREKLLRVNGIGPETADSILLYGLKKPIFVVDAYTKRILHDTE